MAAIEDIGIDLGSSNILVYARGKGIVLNEPSVLAVDHESRSVIAIGIEAYKMMGREPNNIEVVRPLQSGAIRDFDMLGIMLNHFVVMVIGKRVFSRPRAVLSISSTANELEKRQLILGMLEAGVRRTQLLSRPLAAAVGSGINVMPHVGHMIIDIGGANSHVAAIASGEIMTENTEIVGGDAFSDAIIRYVRLKHNLLIGTRTAEDIKCAIGTARNFGDADISLPIAGRNLVSGLPKQIDITRNEVTEAMEDPMRTMLEGIRGVIERLPPELANDVFDNGIMLTGGGAMLKGLQEVISDDIKLPCFTADDPQQCVAAGCGYVLERMEEFGALLGDARRKK